jgi:hypothetical protein
MKKLLFILFGFILSLNSFSQVDYGDLKGFCLKANYKTDDIENVEEEDIVQNTLQLFTFSFKDKIFIHHVLPWDNAETGESESLIDSQIYKITKYEVEDGDGYYVYKVTTESGVSGMTYYYEIGIFEESGILIVKYEDYYYIGNAVFTKTFKQ